MRAVRIAIILAVFVVGCGYSVTVNAQQHDYQDWNLLSVGRIVTLARTNSCVRDKTPNFACGVEESHKAMASMEDVLATFDCISYGEETVPEVSLASPFSRHDLGPVVVAEMKDISCRTLPSTQLVPVNPDEFKKYCSRLEWKCDAVWIPDSDPSVWYIGVIADIPHNPS